MNLEEILSQVDEEFRRAVEQPGNFEFEERKPYKLKVTPEPVRMESATVDLENQNVKIRYRLQRPSENYTCVKHSPENSTALVESSANHELNGKRVTSTMHYLVHGETAYRLENDGYTEAELQQRPVEVAQEYEKLYRKALKQENQEKSLQKKEDREPGTVPPPEDENFYNQK